MQNKPVIYPKGFEDRYLIYEDGRLYSLISKTFLRGQPTMGYGYIQYILAKNGKQKAVKAHVLVLEHFVCPRPEGLECNHKDHDKENNHVSNLEWCTHSQNILKSYREGYREAFWKGRKRGPHSQETLAKMASAKHKPVIAYNNTEILYFPSVENLLTHFDTYRNMFHRRVNSGETFQGYTLTHIY